MIYSIIIPPPLPHSPQKKNVHLLRIPDIINFSCFGSPLQEEDSKDLESFLFLLPATSKEMDEDELTL